MWPSLSLGCDRGPWTENRSSLPEAGAHHGTQQPESNTADNKEVAWLRPLTEQNTLLYILIQMFPTQTLSDKILPASYQSLKILIFQHLLGQLLLCLVPPWTQVCPGGSSFCTLELLFWLQLCHRKAAKMPKMIRETPFNTSSGHQRAQQTFSTPSTNLRLSFETQTTQGHMFLCTPNLSEEKRQLCLRQLLQLGQLCNWARKQNAIFFSTK